MANTYDMVWGLLLTASAPVWLVVPKARRKVVRALRERMGPKASTGDDLSRPGVMIHAVSLGEINATTALVARLSQARPDVRFIVTTTTDAGFKRGQELYGKNRRVVVARYPLDFSRAINRLFTKLRPRVVVLMELEVWPNFLYQADRQGVAVLLVNGRLTPSSYRTYGLGGPVISRMFRRLRLVCAQEQAYADRFVTLGVPPDRVRVTGTMKFDTAQVTTRIEGDAELAAAVGIRRGAEKVWVCGSTGPGEEEIVLRVYRELLRHHPTLRLVIVPRHPDRFDAVAETITRAGYELRRRSQSPDPPPGVPPPRARRADGAGGPPVILGDTMGELRKFYSLASVVLVGRTLVDLGARQRGSDMIEPAALGKPVVVGPWTQNFAEPMRRFEAADAVRVVKDGVELGRQVSELLDSPVVAVEVGRRARDVVRREQGATARHVEAILSVLPPAKHGAETMRSGR